MLSAGQTMWGAGAHTFRGDLYRVRNRGRSRHVVLTTDVTPYHSVYSTTFERKHSDIVVDDGTQHIYTRKYNKQRNKACNDMY